MTNVRTTEPCTRFVAWIDLMGAGNLMRSSLRELATAVRTLNEACGEAANAQIELHPLNDGVFALAADRVEILGFLARAFDKLARRVTAMPLTERRPVRGSLAHGEIVTLYHESPTHSSTVVLGVPKSQAFEAENDAPPFGVFLHGSAVSAGVDERWRWYTARRDDFVEALDAYYDWALANGSYDASRAVAHRASMRRYLMDEA